MPWRLRRSVGYWLVVVFAACEGGQWHGVHRPFVLPDSAVLGQPSTTSWGLRLPEGSDQMYPGWLCCCLLVLPFKYVVSQYPSSTQVFEFCPNFSWPSNVWRPEKCKTEKFSVFHPTLFEITWVVLAFSYCHHNSLYLLLFHLGAKSWSVLVRDLVGWYFPWAQEQLLFDLPHLVLKNFAVCSLPFL